MPQTPKFLFICQHNGGRSQIAAAYLQQMAGDRLHVESAGMRPTERVNPLMAEVMREEGIDISANKPQSVFELFKESRLFGHVITVCHDGESECPIFPGITTRWHMPFEDPAKTIGSEGERLAQVRRIRDQIKAWLEHPPPDGFSYRAIIASET
ncbi:MAG: arsenate reductase ArsC [Desulfosarcinaceae bacterium]|nr:arsenate reductase ArsC [Desulfosarcinaceae bacterium]